MLTKANVVQYLPEFLREYQEFDLICKTENSELNQLWDEISRALNNQFVNSSDDYGISRLEKIFGIFPNKKMETLDFRRDRLINRINLTPPFTLHFLRKQLDAAVGVGKYQVTVDYGNYTLYLESSAVNQAWFEEISFMINQIKPINIVFINKPLNVSEIFISENVACSKVKYNYVLGEWHLGLLPIADFMDNKTVKKGIDMSIRNKLLEIISIETIESIYKVLVNNQHEITDFTLKESDGGTATIEYMVILANLNNNVITNLKLMNNSNDVLSESNVHVPVKDDTLVKHVIKCREGV